MNTNGERGEAFVVWLDPAQPDECTGRVEHVATSKRQVFASGDELVAFLIRAAAERAAVPRITVRIWGS